MRLSVLTFLVVAAIFLPEAVASQDVPTPEATWLAVLASGVSPMPMRWPTYPIRLRPIVLDLRGPAPPVFQMVPMLGEPPQVRRQRRDEND